MSSISAWWRGGALYLLAATLWSINGSVSKTLIAGGFEVLRLSQLRATAGFLALALIVAATRPKRWLPPARQGWLVLALYGVVGIAFTQYLYFLAISLLPIGVALVLEFTAPFIVALWVKFVWGRAVPRQVWLGLAIAMLGLVVITELWSDFSLNPAGVVAGLAAAACFSVYFLAGERALRLGEAQAAQLSSLVLTMWGFAFAALFWFVVAPVGDFPWEALSGASEVMPELSLPNRWLATFMVLGGTVLPFWLVLTAMKFLSAAQASAIGMVEPVLASTIAFFWLGERLTTWQLFGGILTLGGVALAESARIRN